MKLFKNVLLVLLAMFVVFALSACSESDGGNSKESPQPSDNQEPDESDDGAAGEYDNFVMDYSEGIDENGYWTGISAYDYIERFDYLGIEIPKDVHTVTDEAIQSEIDYFIDYYSTTAEITDRAVVDGDNVNIDYVGSIDGIEFTGGSTGSAGTTVTAGSPDYIDDFLDQIIGHTPGETFDVNVTFPEDYGNEELNGKDAVFVTTINYIVEPVVPELNDEFVLANLSEYGWHTVEEMTAEIEKELSASAVAQYIQSYLLNDVVLSSMPESVRQYQENTLISYYSEYATYYGMTLEAFVTSVIQAESLEALLEDSAPDIESGVRYMLAVQAVAEDNKLEVSEIDIQNYFADVMGVTDYSEYEEFYGRPYLVQVVLSEQVGQLLFENAVLLD